VLKYFETFQNKVEAQKREYQIKQYSRLKKLNLILGATQILPSPIPQKFEVTFMEFSHVIE
jgi:predicted GIY-YIG superfamily endonuclease